MEDLAPFVLDNVQGLGGEPMESGAYGVVFEVIILNNIKAIIAS